MTEHVQTQEEDDEINLLDLLQVVADNLRLLVLGPLAVGLLALGISFAIPPTFTANTKFMPPQQQQSVAASMLQGLGALGGLAGAAGIKNPNDQFVTILKSRTLQDALIERFNLVSRYDESQKGEARKELGARSRIGVGKDNLIEVQVDDRDPAFAAELANAYVEEFSRLLGRLALTEAQQRRAFFEKQLGQAKNKLIQAEEALRASGVNSSALKSAPQAAIGAVAQLQAQISAQEVKLASMRGYLTESAPEFMQARTELAALRAQQAKFGAGNSGGGSDGEYIARYRDFKYYETLFELFAKQYELARVDEAREGGVIQVLDRAEPPVHKSKPRRILITLLAILISELILLLFVLFRHAAQKVADYPVRAKQLARLRASLSSAMQWKKR